MLIFFICLTIFYFTKIEISFLLKSYKKKNMSGIGSNIHRNNVSGSGMTVWTALNNEHYENMEMIKEQAALKWLQENNEYYFKN